MKRREVISKVSMFVVAGILGRPVNSSLPTDVVARRESTIYFPDGKSFADFQSDLNSWMDLPRWKRFLDEQRASGALRDVKREVGEHSVTYQYEFRSSVDMQNFERQALVECRVDIRARNRFGYSGQIRSLA